MQSQQINEILQNQLKLRGSHAGIQLDHRIYNPYKKINLPKIEQPRQQRNKNNNKNKNNNNNNNKNKNEELEIKVQHSFDLGNDQRDGLLAIDRESYFLPDYQSYLVNQSFDLPQNPEATRGRYRLTIEQRVMRLKSVQRLSKKYHNELRSNNLDLTPDKSQSKIGQSQSRIGKADLELLDLEDKYLDRDMSNILVSSPQKSAQIGSPSNLRESKEREEDLRFNQYLESRKLFVQRLKKAKVLLKDRLGFYKGTHNWRQDLKNLRVSPHRLSFVPNLEENTSSNGRRSIILTRPWNKEIQKKPNESEQLQKIGLILQKSKQNLEQIKVQNHQIQNEHQTINKSFQKVSHKIDKLNYRADIIY